MLPLYTFTMLYHCDETSGRDTKVKAIHEAEDKDLVDLGPDRKADLS